MNVAYRWDVLWGQRQPIMLREFVTIKLAVPRKDGKPDMRFKRSRAVVRILAEREAT